MPAVITPTSALAPLAGASEAAPQLVLQPGAVIDARVLAVRDNLARILIAGLSMDVLTEVALQPGTNLKLAVSQTPDGTVRLAVVPQEAASQGQASGPLPPAGSNATAATAATQSAGTAAQTVVPRIASTASLVPASPEAIAIAQAVQTSAPRQASLSPLFANLPVIVASKSVPQQVHAAASQLLATRPPLDATLTANDLRQAFQKSGLFLEATLARGAPPAGAPDLKAALVVFRQVLTNWLGPAVSTAQSPVSPVAPAPAVAATPQPLPPQNPAQTVAQSPITALALPMPPGVVPGGVSGLAPGVVPTLAPDRVAANAATSAAQVPPNTADGAVELPTPTSVSAAAQPASTRPRPELSSDVVRTAIQNLARDATALLPGPRADAVDDAAASRPAVQPAGHAIGARPPAEPAPPFRGAMPSAQPIASPSLAPDAPPASVAHQLLEQTDAALARQTLLQVASLPDRLDPGSTNQTAQPRWSFEIPFATPHGTAVAQFEIARDGGNDVEAAAPSRIWRARFTLDVEPAGPVHALVSLIGDKTAVRMWAERPETAAQLRDNTEALGQALRQAELEPGDILIGEGAPPQPKTRAGRFLDRAT